jgi:replication factor C small subunit
MSDEVRNRLLVEKYKPKKIEDLLLEKHMKDKFLEFVEQKDIPILLLKGIPGVGKTASARILAHAISDSVLFMNASSETGVDIVRSRIQPFCMNQTLDDESDIKIVILDEIDGASTQFQYALKENIEKFYGTTRFIFTSNNAHNIDPAIRSRCQEYEFGNIDKKLIARRLVEILKKENIKFDVENIKNVIRCVGTDMRKLLNEIQRLTVDGKLSKFVSSNDKHDVIMDLIKGKDVSGIRKYISEEGVNYDGLLKYMLNNCESLGESWPNIMIDISDVAYKMKVGVDPDIALSAGLVQIMENM